MGFNVGSIVGDASSVVPGGSLVEGVASDLFGGVFKQSSASAASASGAIPKLLQLAMQGNLSAAKIIYDRSTTVGVSSEKAVWQPYLEQLEAAHPSYIALANQEVPQYPFSAGTAQEVLNRALAQPIYVTPGNATAGPNAPPATMKAPGAPSSNTGLLIGLGVGALALVGVLLLVRRH